MKLFAAVMPLFVVGISMVHYHQKTDVYTKNPVSQAFYSTLSTSRYSALFS